MKGTQTSPSLCNSVDCNLPGSSVHGILQARILEWVTVPFSRGSSQARDQTQVSHIAGGYFTVWATREALKGTQKFLLALRPRAEAMIWKGQIQSFKAWVRSRDPKPGSDPEFQRIARRGNKAFLSDQCKEIEENNRMGKMKGLFKKISDTKGTFYAKMGTVRTETVWT